MEKLYNLIINHIALRLKKDELNLSKGDIASKLNIAVETLDEICLKNQLLEFLIELSKNHKAIERFKQITDNWEKIELLDPGKNFIVTRERIKQIEDKAIRLLNKNSNPPDDVA